MACSLIASVTETWTAGVQFTPEVIQHVITCGYVACNFECWCRLLQGAARHQGMHHQHAVRQSHPAQVEGELQLTRRTMSRCAFAASGCTRHLDGNGPWSRQQPCDRRCVDIRRFAVSANLSMFTETPRKFQVQCIVVDLCIRQSVHGTLDRRIAKMKHLCNACQRGCVQ